VGQIDSFRWKRAARRVTRFRRLRDELDLTVFGDRGVRGLVLAHLTSAVGDGIVLAALPFAILAIEGTDGQIGAALAVQAFTMVALLLPSGVVGDRFNRRAVLVAADLLRFGARGAFAFLLIAGEATFWQLLLAQAANGAGTALSNTTMEGFVPEVASGEKMLLRVNAMRVLALSLGMTLGPLIGALVYTVAGTAATFGVDAATFLISAMVIYRLPMPFREVISSPVSLKTLVRDVVEGWNAFWKIRWYWRVAIEFALINALVLAPYFVIGAHISQESFGGSWAWSQILVGLGVGQLVGAVAVMPWEPNRPLLAATSIVALWILPLVALAAVAPLGILAVTAGLGGIAHSMFGSIWETVKQTHTPAHLRARLSSFDHLGGLGFVPVGYLLGAAILETIGATAGLIGGALILAAATAWVIGDTSVRELKPAGHQATQDHQGAAGGPALPQMALATAGND
jgi:MFS family permease